MNTKNTITAILADYMRKEGSLPDFTFTKNGSLQTFVQNMVAGSTETMETGTTPNDIYATLTEYQKMAEDPQYKGMLFAFDRLGSAFAQKLTQAYKNLHHVHDEVSQVTSRIHNEVRNRIAADPVLAASESDVYSNVKLRPIRWDLVKDVSVAGTANRVLSRYDLSEEIAGHSTHRLHSWILDSLPFANPKHDVELTPIQVPKKKAVAMIGNVCKALAGKLSKETVQTCVAHVLTISHEKGVKAVLSIRRLADGDSLEKFNDMLTMVNLYNQILPKMSAENMDVAASTQAEIDKRVDIMRQYIDATAYFCNYYRCTVWKDAIVVPGMQINSDNWQEFCGTDKQPIQSNPHLAIVQYKNRVYGDKDIPVSGIDMKNIVDTCETIAKECREEASSQTALCNRRKKEIFRDVFCETANAWIAQSGAYSAEQVASGAQKRYVAAVYDSNQDDAVENMLYTIMLETSYHDSLESKLQAGLLEEYKKLSLSAESLNERDAINVDQKVVANLVAKFLVDLILV